MTKVAVFDRLYNPRLTETGILTLNPPGTTSLSRRMLVGLAVVAASCVSLAALAGIAIVLALPQLPSLEALTDYRPKIPLKIFTADGHLIGEFGEERRAIVQIDNVPQILKQAILAAEDERFYEHGGVDTLGVIRATLANLTSGGKKQGASTITMQVARNFYLSSSKTYARKLYEVLLSFKIESSLGKDQILQLYLNQIYLGQRAYGFAAASQIYFGKSIRDLSIAEAAMLAGLPKAPSAYNPVANPKRAKLRQQYVLRRMRELRFIDDKQYELANQQVLKVRGNGPDPLAGSETSAHAAFVAEMARQIAFERFQDDTYAKGFKVVTTILKEDQQAAYAALRRAVMDYDRRHGYRGPEAFLDIRDTRPDQEETLDEFLADFADSDELQAAVVLETEAGKVTAYRRGGEVIQLKGDGIKFASRMLDTKAPANKRIRRGAVIRVVADAKLGWTIMQLPDVEAAFVSADPQTGAIRALVGGFDFSRNKFNHVTQAWRQPGSSFKPFIYSAALEKGYSPATVIEDEPLMITAAETGDQDWEPKNYDGKFEGAMSMRTALSKSKNMVSIRILREITPKYAQDYATRFGFDAQRIPPFLTMALGAGSVTPWQSLAGYAVFANGGYRIDPFIVKEIRDENDVVLARFQPRAAGEENLRVIDGRNVFLMNSMLRDVTISGTAARASATLKRRDLAGKTGTTNEYVDAWFAGYHESVVGIAWIGFDQPKKLGNGETGGVAALPIWTDYMAHALKDVPESLPAIPDGLVAVQVMRPDGSVGRDFVYEENVPDSGHDLAEDPVER